MLADHWQDGFDAARGEFVRLQCEGIAAGALVEANRQRWLRTARAAGFSDAALELVRGFVQTALVVEDGEPLDGCPDGLRLSLRQYRVVRYIREEEYRHVFELAPTAWRPEPARGGVGTRTALSAALFLLRPDGTTNNAFLYCLIHAALRCDRSSH